MITMDPVLLERVWSRIDVGEPDECWPWTRGRHSYGYGQIRYPKSTLHYVHRLVSRAKPGQEVRHLCDNPPCCNPLHLVLGTHRDNIADMNERGRNVNQRKTHCPRGHPYDSLIHRSRGPERRCRTCKNEAMREYRRRDAQGTA